MVVLLVDVNFHLLFLQVSKQKGRLAIAQHSTNFSVSHLELLGEEEEGDGDEDERDAADEEAAPPHPHPVTVRRV